MKRLLKCLGVVMVVILLYSDVSGQTINKKPGSERIDAQRVAFITQRLKLTPAEAEKFWPLYNEYRDGLKAMREDVERPDLDMISEDEALQLMDQHLRQEQHKLDLKIRLMTRLKLVLPAKKIIRLHTAEVAFNRELLRRVQEGHKE